MTISLCGSTLFYAHMDEIKGALAGRGYNVLHPRDTAVELDESLRDLDKDESHKSDMSDSGRNSRYKLIISHLEAIKKSDAILVVNLEKNGNENYIGGNTFLEMGFALALGKKIFVLNPLPDYSAYYDELTGMLPTIIDDDLTRIEIG